jgi:hypothetical protein
LCVAWLVASAGRAVAEDSTPSNAVPVGEKESETGFTNRGEQGLVAFLHNDDSLAVGPELDNRAGVG